jgi:DNA repair exonuclease SbcCD ATPase subunit
MLRYKTLSWSNAFSYGSNNSIDFSNPLVQLVGRNGHGKSSIALILEEVLYNKNSKGIKKAGILNRYVKGNSYEITLEFEKDSDDYLISSVRGATQKVILLKNGDDISAHTATATYKLIEEIIGYDHKTFTQIVYQSNAFSLEFLTATDTNRKKFLIDLLDLDRYTEIGESIKPDVKALNQDLELVTMKINSINSWLGKIKADDTIKLDRMEVPEAPTLESTELASIQESLRTLAQTNKRIQQNNTYKKILGNLHVEVVPAPTMNIVDLRVKRGEIANSIVKHKSVTSATITSNCKTCGQPIDNSHKIHMAKESEVKLAPLAQQLSEIDDLILQVEQQTRKYDASVMVMMDIEKYSSLIDHSLPEDPLDEKELNSKAVVLQTKIQEVTSAINTANNRNKVVDTHNAKADVILSQLDEMMSDKQTLTEKSKELLARLANLQILSKTFSPSGFVAYKIEASVKDLEILTNKYLTDMSDGRFQLSFRISSSDKLDVVITDNGQDIDIAALSNGELSRVNISTLLAIRKLMESLSNTRTNLLILDETVESLDIDGKEKLVELLLKEEHLNTVLISHGFSHPLLTKIEIIKTKNISRIE